MGVFFHGIPASDHVFDRISLRMKICMVFSTAGKVEMIILIGRIQSGSEIARNRACCQHGDSPVPDRLSWMVQLSYCGAKMSVSVPKTVPAL